MRLARAAYFFALEAGSPFTAAVIFLSAGAARDGDRKTAGDKSAAEKAPQKK